jgi:thiol-disulfide isomerase/thioredoxin
MNTHSSIKFYITAATLLWLAALAPAQASLKTGDDFPDVGKFKIDGKLPDSLKGKIVLVDFWASWCGPCAASFPAMEALHGQYKDKGVVILAVSVDKKPADMEAFLKKHAASFTVVRDVEQRLVAATEADAMPTSFLLDGAGKVRFVHKGFRGEESRKKYIEEIEALLKENQ